MAKTCKIIPSFKTRPRRKTTPAADKLRAARNVLEVRRMIVLEKFIKLNPPTFGAKPDPSAAEAWLEAVKAKMDRAGVPWEYRVGFAAYLFEGSAEDWWDRWDIADNEVRWDEFEELFRGTYAPETAKGAARLRRLAQEGAAVEEYRARFTELYRGDPAATGAEFRRGLNPKIRSRLRGLAESAGLEELVRAALRAERELRRQRMKQAVCRRCGAVGHWKRKCPLRKQAGAVAGGARGGGRFGPKPSGLSAARQSQQYFWPHCNLPRIGGPSQFQCNGR